MDSVWAQMGACRPSSRDEALVIGGVLPVLFLLALVAAQSGPVGILLSLFAVILIAGAGESDRLS